MFLKDGKRRAELAVLACHYILQAVRDPISGLAIHELGLGDLKEEGEIRSAPSIVYIRGLSFVRDWGSGCLLTPVAVASHPTPVGRPCVSSRGALRGHRLDRIHLGFRGDPSYTAGKNRAYLLGWPRQRL
jgi:hypothetical protein